MQFLFLLFQKGKWPFSSTNRYVYTYLEREKKRGERKRKKEREEREKEKERKRDRSKYMVLNLLRERRGVKDERDIYIMHNSGWMRI